MQTQSVTVTNTLARLKVNGHKAFDLMIQLDRAMHDLPVGVQAFDDLRAALRESLVYSPMDRPN